MHYRFRFLPFLGGVLGFLLLTGLTIGVYKGLTNYNKKNYQEKPSNDYNKIAENASRM